MIKLVIVRLIVESPNCLRVANVEAQGAAAAALRLQLGPGILVQS